MRDSTGALLDAAAAVIRTHRSGPDGFCLGCLDLWARLVTSPCAQTVWALAVVETHGVTQWDPRPRPALIGDRPGR